ncbi:MAG: MBL fold metallo-hydrolase [Thermodesulfobacteriota bacterium]
MALSVTQFRYGPDNLAYVVFGASEALAVDGGAVQRILAFCKEKGLALRFAANTHGHPDHTSGTAELAAEAGAEILSNPRLKKEGFVTVDGERVRVISTPGHTMDSLCFLAESFLLSGDTLFNATIGNCFSGDIAAFYRSVATLMALPPETLVLAGHDYVEESLAFAHHLEPGNPAIEAYEKKYDPRFVRSTIADELAVNPYFRFNQSSIMALLKKRGLPVETEFERFSSLMKVA